MSRFCITELPLSGLKLVQRQRLGDARGFLSRLFCTQELAAAGWLQPVAQINHTYTAHRGTVRGLHYQKPPAAETKLVSCLRGSIWDVVVDLRANSPTFLQWHAEYLSLENERALVIPQGFAHGFQTLSNEVDLLYCHSVQHTPLSEAGIDALDVRLAIAWPLPIAQRSARDQTLASLGPDFEGLLC